MSTWASVVKAAAISSNNEKGLDLSSENIKIAVVDATALIKGFSLKALGDVIVTVQEVLDEVRDKQSRGWLHALPYEIKALDPEPECVKTAVSFSRDTGDLPFLSITDIKLIALTFQLEKALHGTEHISTCPVIQRKLKSAHSGSPSVLPGWGVVSNPEDWEPIDRQNAVEVETEGGHGEGSRIRRVHPLNAAATEMLDPCNGKEMDEAGSETITDESYNDQEMNDKTASHLAEHETSAVPQETESAQGRLDDERQNHSDNWIPVGRNQRKDRRQGIGHQDGDKHKMSEMPSRVCCQTSDFGIQNVLLQMGLNLVTPDGVRIRHLSKYALKCASCSKVTRRKEAIFCPHCGNATLYKVRLEIGQNGMEVIGGLVHPSQRRGAKCKIPPPKGGKKNTDAIVSEDMMHQAMHQYRNMKHKNITDVFGPEYNEDSWFKSRAIKNELKDQLPGRFGYPRGMNKYVPHRRKR